MTLRHTFVSGIADDAGAASAGEILPQSHWNADHTVGGTSLQVQYNNAGSLSGMSGTSWDNTNSILTIAGAPITGDAAGILAQRNGTNAQTFRVYNTFTDASNYERGIFDWQSNTNVLTIGTQFSGTGNQRAVLLNGQGQVNIGLAGVSYIQFSSSGALALAAGGGNAFLAFSGASSFGLSSSPSVDTSVSRSAAAVIAFGNGAAGDGSATILAKTKAGAPTISDVLAGTWALIRDTTNSTTKIYYNNAGTLQSVALA